MKQLKNFVLGGFALFALISLMGFLLAALGGDLERPKIRADLSCSDNAKAEKRSLHMREERKLTLRVADMRIEGEPDYKVKYVIAKRMAEIEMDAKKRHDDILELCRSARGEE